MTNVSLVSHILLLFPNSCVKKNKLFVHHPNTREGEKNSLFVEILYSSKIVYFQTDWFTEYDKIMIEH